MLLVHSSVSGHIFLFSLRVWRDAHLGHGPLCAIDILELLEHDLDFLPIGRIHGEEVEALAILDVSIVPILSKPRPA